MSLSLTIANLTAAQVAALVSFCEQQNIGATVGVVPNVETAEAAPAVTRRSNKPAPTANVEPAAAPISAPVVTAPVANAANAANAADGKPGPKPGIRNAAGEILKNAEGKKITDPALIHTAVNGDKPATTAPSRRVKTDGEPVANKPAPVTAAKPTPTSAPALPAPVATAEAAPVKPAAKITAMGYEAGGKAATKFSGKSKAIGRFAEALGAEVDEDGSIYVMGTLADLTKKVNKAAPGAFVIAEEDETEAA